MFLGFLMLNIIALLSFTIIIWLVVVAEATPHELGHNFGGAGSGSTSWGPIMGASYFRLEY